MVSPVHRQVVFPIHQRDIQMRSLPVLDSSDQVSSDSDKMAAVHIAAWRSTKEVEIYEHSGTSSLWCWFNKFQISQARRVFHWNELRIVLQTWRCFTQTYFLCLMPGSLIFCRNIESERNVNMAAPSWYNNHVLTICLSFKSRQLIFIKCFDMEFVNYKQQTTTKIEIEDHHALKR